jgi:hypothetical protein
MAIRVTRAEPVRTLVVARFTPLGLHATMSIRRRVWMPPPAGTATPVTGDVDLTLHELRFIE